MLARRSLSATDGFPIPKVGVWALCWGQTSEPRSVERKWCPGPDSNRHDAFRLRRILSPLCLPISPPGPRAILLRRAEEANCSVPSDYPKAPPKKSRASSRGKIKENRRLNSLHIALHKAIQSTTCDP